MDVDMGVAGGFYADPGEIDQRGTHHRSHETGQTRHIKKGPNISTKARRSATQAPSQPESNNVCTFNLGTDTAQPMQKDTAVSEAKRFKLTPEEVRTGLCSVCGVMFSPKSNAAALYRHIKYFHEPSKPNLRFGPTTCKICTASFENSNFDMALYDHMKTVHQLVPQFHCKWCKRSFPSEQARVLHEVDHASRPSEHNFQGCTKATTPIPIASDMWTQRQQTHLSTDEVNVEEESASAPERPIKPEVHTQHPITAEDEQQQEAVVQHLGSNKFIIILNAKKTEAGTEVSYSEDGLIQQAQLVEVDDLSDPRVAEAIQFQIQNGEAVHMQETDGAENVGQFNMETGVDVFQIQFHDSETLAWEEAQYEEQQLVWDDGESVEAMEEGEADQMIIKQELKLTQEDLIIPITLASEVTPPETAMPPLIETVLPPSQLDASLITMPSLIQINPPHEPAPTATMPPLIQIAPSHSESTAPPAAMPPLIQIVPPLPRETGLPSTKKASDVKVIVTAENLNCPEPPISPPSQLEVSPLADSDATSQDEPPKEVLESNDFNEVSKACNVQEVLKASDFQDLLQLDEDDGGKDKTPSQVTVNTEKQDPEKEDEDEVESDIELVDLVSESETWEPPLSKSNSSDYEVQVEIASVTSNELSSIRVPPKIGKGKRKMASTPPALHTSRPQSKPPTKGKRTPANKSGVTDEPPRKKIPPYITVKVVIPVASRERKRRLDSKLNEICGMIRELVDVSMETDDDDIDIPDDPLMAAYDEPEHTLVRPQKKKESAKGSSLLAKKTEIAKGCSPLAKKTESATGRSRPAKKTQSAERSSTAKKTKEPASSHPALKDAGSRRDTSVSGDLRALSTAHDEPEQTLVRPQKTESAKGSSPLAKKTEIAKECLPPAKKTESAEGRSRPAKKTQSAKRSSTAKKTKEPASSHQALKDAGSTQDENIVGDLHELSTAQDEPEQTIVRPQKETESAKGSSPPAKKRKTESAKGSSPTAKKTKARSLSHIVLKDAGSAQDTNIVGDLHGLSTAQDEPEPTLVRPQKETESGNGSSPPAKKVKEPAPSHTALKDAGSTQDTNMVGDLSGMSIEGMLEARSKLLVPLRPRSRFVTGFSPSPPFVPSRIRRVPRKPTSLRRGTRTRKTKNFAFE